MPLSDVHQSNVTHIYQKVEVNIFIKSEILKVKL